MLIRSLSLLASESVKADCNANAEHVSSDDMVNGNSNNNRKEMIAVAAHRQRMSAAGGGNSPREFVEGKDDQADVENKNQQPVRITAYEAAEGASALIENVKNSAACQQLLLHAKQALAVKHAISGLEDAQRYQTAMTLLLPSADSGAANYLRNQIEKAAVNTEEKRRAVELAQATLNRVAQDTRAAVHQWEQFQRLYGVRELKREKLANNSVTSSRRRSRGYGADEDDKHKRVRKSEQERLAMDNLNNDMEDTKTELHETSQNSLVLGTPGASNADIEMTSPIIGLQQQSLDFFHEAASENNQIADRWALEGQSGAQERFKDNEQPKLEEEAEQKTNSLSGMFKQLGQALAVDILSPLSNDNHVQPTGNTIDDNHDFLVHVLEVASPSLSFDWNTTTISSQQQEQVADESTVRRHETKDDKQAVLSFVYDCLESMEGIFTMKSRAYQTYLKAYLPEPSADKQRYILNIVHPPRIPANAYEEECIEGLRTLEDSATPNKRLGADGGAGVKMAENLENLLTSIVNKAMLLLVVEHGTWYIHAPAREQLASYLLQYIWPNRPLIQNNFRQFFSNFVEVRVRHFRDSVARHFRERAKHQNQSTVGSSGGWVPPLLQADFVGTLNEQQTRVARSSSIASTAVNVVTAGELDKHPELQKQERQELTAAQSEKEIVAIDSSRQEDATKLQSSPLSPPRTTRTSLRLLSRRRAVVAAGH